MGIGLLVLGIPVAFVYAKGETLRAFFKASFTRETLRAFFTSEALGAVSTTLKALWATVTAFCNGDAVNVFFRGETLNGKTEITVVDKRRNPADA